MWWGLDVETDEFNDGETEPSLGSFDRMMDQTKFWRQADSAALASTDAGQDDQRPGR
jgi:hypothetical protein